MIAKDYLGAYRDELKGIAMIWVVYFHAVLSITGILSYIQKIGYGGADIFIFLTGFGLYYSLGKTGELSDYFKRRMRRILRAYLPLILCYLLVMIPSIDLTTTQMIRSVIGNLLMVGFWFNTPGQFNWYVSALFLFVVIAPILYAFLIKSTKRSRTLLLLLGWAFLMGLCLIGDRRYMGISRLPVFIMGMFVASDWHLALSPWIKRLLLTLSFVIGVIVLLLCFDHYPWLLYDYGMYWHPFLLITPPLCIFTSYLLSKLDCVRFISKPLRIVGQASFEIYLLNAWLEEWAKREKLTGDLLWLGLSLGSILSGILYHQLVRILESKIQRKNIQPA